MLLLLAAATIYLSPVRLNDSDGDGKVVIQTAKTVPQAPRGKPVYECPWRRGGQWAYSAAPCPATDPDLAEVRVASAITAPVITTAQVKASPKLTASAPRYSDVSIDYAGKAYQLGSSTEPVTISDVAIGSGTYGVYHSSATGRPITISRMRGTFWTAGVAIWAPDRITITDSVFIGQGSAAYTAGIKIGGNTKAGGATLVASRVEVANWKTAKPSGYPNADGIATEEHDSWALTDIYSHDNTDGCYDLKGRGTGDRLTAERCGRGFRFWGDVAVGTITSRDMKYTHVWVGGRTHIRKLIASGSGGLLTVNKGASLTIDECDLTGWTGKNKVSGAGKLVLGKGC